MPDNRPLREKLEAMASQTSSPEEATVARAMLTMLSSSRASARPGKSERVISRERIMAAADRDSPPKTVRWRTKSGTWIEADLDLFEIDEEGRLVYRG